MWNKAETEIAHTDTEKECARGRKGAQQLGCQLKYSMWYVCVFGQCTCVWVNRIQTSICMPAVAHGLPLYPPPIRLVG